MEGKKRQRPVTSCLACRKRRLKCDRIHPLCGRCRSGGTECVYDENLARSPIPQGASTSQLPSSASTSYDRTEQPRVEGARTDRGYLHVEASLSAMLTHGTTVAEPSSRRSDLERGQVMVYDGGRSAYVSSTYWANAIPSEFNRGIPETPFPNFPSAMQDQSQQWVGQKFRPPRNQDFAWMKASSNICKLCGRNYNLSCVMALLPSRSMCEKLCEVFFSNVFPLVPVFHAKGFADDFKSFWDGINTENLHNSEPSLFMRRNPAFLSLLSAIMFAALNSASPTRLERLFESSPKLNAGDIYFMAMVSATLTGFPRRPSLYSLAAYIIAQSQFVREEEFSDAPDLIATSFRVALGMGLHRQLPGSKFGAAELETRRRLWWYILHLDVMSSSSSGLSPLFIDRKMANTEGISQYDPQNGDDRAQHEVDMRYLVASHRYAITKAIRDLLVLHFEDGFRSLEAVEECGRQLRAVSIRTKETVATLLEVGRNAGATAPPMTRGVEPAHVAFDRVWSLRPHPDDKEVHNFSAWAALLLHLMIHKAYCVLYHPLFRDPAMVAIESIRTNAVKHAQAFIQLFLRVCNDPISEPYHWMYPGTYQPLQAVSLLLVDLLRHPQSDDADLSRGLVDGIFELYQVDEGIVSQNDPPVRQLSPSGREAWTMLVRTRQRALQQIGLDSHVLFPSNMARSSSRCICGEKISMEGHDAGVRASQGRRAQSAVPSMAPSGNITGSHLPDEMQEEDAPQSPGEMLYDQVDFDWHEWDNALGPSVGLMP